VSNTASTASSARSASKTRMQHLIPATIILALALSVTYLSFIREPADAFLFPRFIASVMLLLAIWNFVRALLGMARIGDGLTLQVVRNVLPGLLIISVFALFAAKYFGFYLASWCAFLGVYSLYDPASHTEFKTWKKRLIVTTLFMVVIYCLFSLLLKVQTPRGLFL